MSLHDDCACRSSGAAAALTWAIPAIWTGNNYKHSLVCLTSTNHHLSRCDTLFRSVHRAALAYLNQGGVAASGLASHPELLNSLFASAADLHDLGLTVLCKISVYDVARAKFGASISLSEQAEFLHRARKQVCACVQKQERAAWQ